VMSPALYADIKRQMEEAVAKRHDPVRIARRNTVMCIKEKALRDAGVKDNTDWLRST
jgi:hypothetical protein